MGLHPCGHNVQPSAGTAQGKPMDMTTEGSHGASGPLWTRLCPGHYSVPDPLGLHSNRGLWRGFWSLSSSVNSDPMSKCPQNVPFPQCAVCSQWRKLLSQEILKSPRLCQSVTGKKKKKNLSLIFFLQGHQSFLIRIPPFPSFKDDYLLRALSSNTVTLGARTSIDEFRGNTIQYKAGRLVPLNPVRMRSCLLPGHKWHSPRTPSYHPFPGTSLASPTSVWISQQVDAKTR